MTFTCRLIAAAILTVGAVPTSARPQQEPDSSSQLFFDHGVIGDGVYTNQCLGLSFPIPQGWRIATIPGLIEGQALRLPGGGLNLLIVDRQSGEPLSGRISLNAQDASDATLILQDSVSASAHRMVDADPQRREVLHAFAVKYGGREFFRADYKQPFSGDKTLYVSSIYTRYRGYQIGASVTAMSPEALDEAASLMAHLSFQEDKPNPACVLGPDDGPKIGVIGRVLSSKPGAAGSGTAQRVRVSSAVAEGLLVKRVAPEYPEAARREGIQGRVTVAIEIDADGSVESATLLTGDAKLAPAAIEAVKQWKYKPYLLNGQPMKVVTQAIVIFSLQN